MDAQDEPQRFRSMHLTSANSKVWLLVLEEAMFTHPSNLVEMLTADWDPAGLMVQPVSQS